VSSRLKTLILIGALAVLVVGIAVLNARSTTSANTGANHNSRRTSASSCYPELYRIEKDLGANGA